EVDIQRFTLAANAGGGGPGINVFAPADWSGQVAPNSSDPIMLSMNDDAWGGSTEDMITVHTFNIDWENPDNTSVSSEPLTASPFDTDPCFPDSGQFGQCVPQAGGEGVSGIPEIIMNQVHYRNFGTHESLVCAFTVDAEPGNNKAGIRWMEMRKTSGESWSIYQEGTYAPDDGFSRFVPSIAMDAKGNIGLMYSASSPETFIDLRFTGRRAIDPLGEMTVEEYILADGESTLITGTRFGDYAHMTIDPMDESTFWLTGEYAGANNDGATRIASFKLRRDTTDFGVTALLSPTNSPDLTASETVSMQITNLGLDTQSVFQVGYILENEAPVIDNVMFELHPDSIYEHSFAQTIDLSVIGDYSLRTFVVLDGDQAIFNDTLRSVVSKLPRFDAGITGTDGLEFVQCADSTTVLLELTNFGTEVLEMVNINLELNGNMLPTVQWTGMLETGESTQVEVELPGLINGTNELIATTSEPNGMTDEIMVNDSFSRSFDAVADGGIGAIIEIQTDDWPFETTWVITDDETGNVVSSGGPYDMQNNLFTTEVCLDSEKCYTFTIFDDYGDGICCAYGFGFYRILDSEGNILVSGNGEFADEESTQFCAEFECLLTATTEASPETASGTNDGSILVTPANGAGPFLFSIDGGETFQDFELFSNLPGGEYEILISDANGCTTTVSVVVDILNSLEVLENDAAIVVFPNPTDGVFRINAKNLSSNNIMIDWTLYNTEGKIVQTGKLAKYDDTHTAMVSLYAYPTGTYYLSIDDTAVRHMTKIVRQ
ncbi:MAG: T9SS type A sorting domain-containing protein, partial [Saprospiraceae bacterium]|nr:T9SS type A sorting domain-containing protein [Saprospiraceae bacterium]